MHITSYDCALELSRALHWRKAVFARVQVYGEVKSALELYAKIKIHRISGHDAVTEILSASLLTLCFHGALE